MTEGRYARPGLASYYDQAVGPLRITPRTWSIDTASAGNSTSHHVAPASL